MHCPTCHRVMLCTSSQVTQGEQGIMTITRWRCRPCHETAEQIWLSAGDCGLEPTRIRYAVVPQRRRPILAAARAAVGRGVPADVGVV
jgi:hypothetical protein